MLLGADPQLLALIAVMALVVNIMLGGLLIFYLAVPFSPLNLILWLTGKLNRFRRSDATRRRRGGMMVAIIALVCFTVGMFLMRLWSLPESGLLQAILVFILVCSLGIGPIFDWIEKLQGLLKRSKGSPIPSTLLDARLMRRQQPEYDHPTVLRAAIEGMMLGASATVIAPLFYFLLLGWPGLLLVTAANLMAHAIGYQNAQYKDFGAAAARLNAVLQAIPARVTAMLICLAAALAPACSPGSAWRMLREQRGKTVAPHAGWILAPAAGALGITLAGPRAVMNSFIADGWIGEGSVQPDIRALKAARWLLGIMILLLLMILIGIAAV
jgi:adenosylcobinamide-phosphate synthase